VKVRVTLPALADLDDIFDHFDARSPQGARRFQSRVKSLIGILPRHPFAGSRTDDSEIRRLVATPYPYCLFYETGDDEIIIHAFRHAARDPSSMLGTV
jgi:plasmid stabilization system protein ParE